MKIRTKLIIGFSVIVVLLWLIIVYTGYNFGNLNRQFSAVEEDIIPDTIAMTEVETISNEIYRDVTEYLYRDYLYYDIEAAKNAALLKLSRLEEIRLEYLPITALPGMLENGKDCMSEHGKDCILAEKIFDFYFSATGIIDLKERGADYGELLARDRTVFLPALLSMQQRAGELKAASIAELTTVKTAFDRAFNSGTHSIFLSAALITLLAIAAVLFTTRIILRPLLALRKGTEMIAKGKLDYKVGTEARDEIGELSRAFDQMTQSLGTSMTSIDNLNQEIAERKRAEEALGNEAIWRRILIEQSGDGIVVLDQNGNVYESNQRFAEMLGYSPEEVRHLSVWDWEFQYPPEQVLEMIRSVDETGDHFETQHRRKDGTIYDVEISTNGAVFAGEKLIFCVCRDITARKRAEESLRESEEKFSAAFRSSPDMMIITNLKTGKYVEVNDSFVNFSGYSRDELVGHTNQEFNMWVNPEEEKKMIRLMDENGKVRHEEFHFRTKSGEIRTWLCSADIINIGGDPCMLAVATDITERKKAQEALRESEERFSKAFHASPGSMSISRLKDGTFIEVNESFLRDKGYTREDVIGHSSTELGIWKDEEHRNKVLQMLQEQGRVHNEPTQFRTKSGEIHTGYLSAEFINLGNEPCMIVLTTDTTQLTQAEEQLRLLSSVTQQVSDSTIVIDPDFKITYMNQASQDLFGYTLEEARGKRLGLFDAKPMTEKEKKEIYRTISNGKVYTSIATKRRKDGSTIICDCRLSPLYDEKGKVFSYIDVHRDITEQKEVEAKLQVQKQLIERILATTPEGVLVIDRNDRIILANEAFHNIFHDGKKAISNKLLNEIIPVNQLLNLYKTVKRGKKENNTLEFRYQVKTLEKRIICVIIKMDGERTLLTFTDVSQEREEEEKLYLTDRLASIGEMAAGLAHELNNPLTGILALSQLLMDSDLSEEHREDLECVYSEAKRAASIVKNVLLFTRNNNYENGQASTNEVVKDVLRLREYEEKENNITAATNLQENLPDIPMDKFQLQQAFLNIILNAESAIKETNRPGILTVTTERVNNHINIHFKDNGCGIKKNILPRIFDPFFTTKDIGKGTGLGLSICYGIVVKHGGEMSVKTRVNKGTTFTIKMPVVPEIV